MLLNYNRNIMKKLLFLLVVVVSWETGRAQYRPVDQGSTTQFTVQNFGFDVTGSFTGLHGTIAFDPANTANAHFDVDIDARTVNTDNSLRDSHLRDESYFDVAKHPVIRLASTKIAATDKKETFLFTGRLTIKNTTKDISFPFQVIQSGDGFVFKGSFKIKRKDFDVGGTSTISDELEVHLNIVAKKA
jgi:polyisoprenoid-binding protein YceI